jgi:hypothetical protein
VLAMSVDQRYRRTLLTFRPHKPGLDRHILEVFSMVKGPKIAAKIT